MVWAHPGNSKATLMAFLGALGEQRRAHITHVTCDGAQWIHETVAEACPNAVICMDAFHVVAWVNNAVDEIRRDLWNEHRKAGDQQLADAIKGTRWALLKNPENLTTGQQVKLADVERNNQPLYRAYLLKEQLRLLLKQPAQAAAGLLDQWLVWASTCALEPIMKVARTVARIRPQIDATLEHGLSNGIVESVNAKIRLIQQRAFGFHHPEALIALAQLNLSGLCPPLPGRTLK